MPIRKFNPTSPGTRFQTVQTFDDITTSEPHKPLVEPLHESGGRNNQRPPHLVVARRRPQADVPDHRLQARQARHPGEGLDGRVRPEPIGADCAPDLRRRREALHPPADRAEGRRHDRGGRQRRHPAGQRAPAEEHPARHAGAQRRAEAGQGRPDRAQRRVVGAGGRQGRRVRVGEDAVGRDSQDQHRVLRDHRPGRQPRSRERLDRQSRSEPLAGAAAARARRGDEPGRPPARRR